MASHTKQYYVHKTHWAKDPCHIAGTENYRSDDTSEVTCKICRSHIWFAKESAQQNADKPMSIDETVAYLEGTEVKPAEKPVAPAVEKPPIPHHYSVHNVQMEINGVINDVMNMWHTYGFRGTVSGCVQDEAISLEFKISTNDKEDNQ